MQLLMIFSLLCMTALFVFTAFRLNEPEAQKESTLTILLCSFGLSKVFFRKIETTHTL
ncbi:hypothetical protein I587_01691 [Enterococcus mundtii ATCC 882]|nr:hypothetical protein UAC_01143 [Enterococcus mundtii ATCC 882]EOU13143.1 hypothetical protein I587_01691 [Enterococcus mundtii ATCC 882]